MAYAGHLDALSTPDVDGQVAYPTTVGERVSVLDRTRWVRLDALRAPDVDGQVAYPTTVGERVSVLDRTRWVRLDSARSKRSETVAAKVLVVAPAWVGDMVMAHTLVPGVVDRGGVVEFLAPLATSGLARRMPGVSAVHELRVGHGTLGLRERARVARRLKARRFDQAIILPNSFKSAIAPFLAGIPRRTGFTGEARYGLLNDRRRLDTGNQPRLVDRFAALADVAPENPGLRSDPARREALCADLDLRGDTLIALCPGAEYGSSKRWPAERFAGLARRLAAKGAGVFILGNARDAELGRSIARRSPALDLTGKTDLLDAVDILSAASAAVTNDSGLMHVAAALGVPVAGIYGSTTPAFTPPLSTRSLAIGHDLPCRPCFRRECPLGHRACLTHTSVDRVMGALAALGVVSA